MHTAVRALPVDPAVSGFGTGRHNFGYWSTIVAPAFDFVARELSS
ncbi:hypothetical protein [Actinoplanes sp. TBRC 11911]|nr:hypothetical protein [Actinoplanes sp. TBRC 11911]